jgi:hypothetical protein
MKGGRYHHSHHEAREEVGPSGCGPNQGSTRPGGLPLIALHHSRRVLSSCGSSRTGTRFTLTLACSGDLC